MRVSVLGAGAWGTALATVLATASDEVMLWTWQSEHCQDMRLHRSNREFLAGVPLPEGLRVTDDLKEAAGFAELLVLVVPSHALRSTLAVARPELAAEVPIVVASKGIEEGSLQLMSEVVSDEITWAPELVGVLSGPSFAREVAQGIPTNLVSASRSLDLATRIQQRFARDWLRVYTSSDPIGVEIGGALKNVIAIAAGACDGLGFGANTRAALITRGIAEMGRLTAAKGGERITVAGLAGIGDLVLTCTGDMSRNRTLGKKLGEGQSVQEALSSSQGVAEGYRTAQSAHDLALRLGVDAPITQAVYSVLHGGKSIREALHALLARPLHGEWE